MIFDRLTERIVKTQCPVCVGLDTALGYLPEELQARGTEGIFEFNRRVIDSVADIVPSVKVQSAYYEVYGEQGALCFRRTMEYAKERGLIVIADAKRNDIGATAAQYAEAFLGEGSAADLVTVNGYLGTDGILPFLERCSRSGKGIFVLVKTSNPSSGELQNLRLEDGRTVYECMGDMAEKWGEGTRGEYGYSCVGAVVGATYPEEAKILRARLPHTFFLIPGYGAQGGNAAMLKNCFSAGGLGGIVNNSRGILCAYKHRGGDYAEAARAATLDMKADLLGVLGEICARS